MVGGGGRAGSQAWTRRTLLWSTTHTLTAAILHYLPPKEKLPVTIEFVGKKEGNLLDIALGSDFLNLTPKATKANINKWD